MESVYYLTNSNKKFVKIGITPATNLLNFGGFYVEISISGKVKAMNLGGIDGFLSLCNSAKHCQNAKLCH